MHRRSLNQRRNGERCTAVLLIPGRYSDSTVRICRSYCCTQRAIWYEYVVYWSDACVKKVRWQSCIIQTESILHDEDNNKHLQSTLTDVIQATEVARITQALLRWNVRGRTQRVRRCWSDVKVFRSSSESVSVQDSWLICTGFYSVDFQWKDHKLKHDKSIDTRTLDDKELFTKSLMIEQSDIMTESDIDIVRNHHFLQCVRVK